MSSFDLYDFNGSIKRNRPQEAMFDTMNSREVFLKKLQESRKERAEDVRRLDAVRVLQAYWRGTLQRKRSKNKLRRLFDDGGSMDNEMRRLAYFYTIHIDDDRVTSLCTSILLSKPEPIFPIALKTYFVKRAVIPFISSSSTCTNVSSSLRFLEVFTSPNEWRIFVQHGLFDALCHHFDSRSCSLALNTEEVNLPPQLCSIVNSILTPLQYLPTRTLCATHLLLSLSRISSPHSLSSIGLLLCPSLSRSLPPSLFIDCMNEIVNGGVSPPCHSPLPFHLFLISLVNLSDDVSVDVYSSLLACLHLLCPSSSLFNSLPPPLRSTIDCRLSSSRFFSILQIVPFSSCLARCLIELSSISSSLRECIGFLSQSVPFLKSFWTYLSTLSLNPSSSWTCLNLLTTAILPPESDRSLVIHSLILFCRLLSLHVLRIDDSSFLPSSWNVAFSLEEFKVILKTLRDVVMGLVVLVCPDQKTGDIFDELKKRKAEWEGAFGQVVSLLRDIHAKDQRIMFLENGFWSAGMKEVQLSRRSFMYRGRTNQHYTFLRYLVDSDSGSDSDDEELKELKEKRKVKLNASDSRSITIMKSIPFVVPFMERVKVLRELIHDDKERFMSHQQISVAVRRTHLYEDAFSDLSPQNAPTLRPTLRVLMHNWAGATEAGVDGGGIFREFMSEVMKEALDVKRGLFTHTNDHLLYPNPLSPLLDPDFQSHFYFIGRLLGKALYEGQLLDVRLADFFLSQLFAPSRTDSDLVQMRSLDPIVYSNLLNLRDLPAEKVKELDLDFSIIVDELGRTRKIELIPNGATVRVTSENRLEYIQQYANYYLHTRIGPMIDSLRNGVSNVIDPRWLAIFSARELALVVSGEEGDIDVEDLRKNTVVHHARGGNEDEEYMRLFWDVIRQFSPQEKRLFVKFVTGCGRPPLGGFEELHPKVGIQLIPYEDRLPTSATCMNLLKLPRYKSTQVMAERVKYAIQAGAGFELS